MHPHKVLMRASGDSQLVFSEAPMLVYWELTRACDLACKHCRAEAIAHRDPGELSTAEAKTLLGQLRSFGTPAPHLVMTGGDPLKRPDLFELIEHAIHLGLKVSIAPSGTNNLTRDVIAHFKACGVQSMSLSLDGSTAEKHDAFRGVAGCFAWTLQAARYAHEEGLPLQINTLVTADTAEDLPHIYELLKGLGIMRWSLFFLVAVGRGRLLRELTPARCEALHHWLYDLSKEAPFAVKTTEAPHFRRVAFLRMRAEGLDVMSIRRTSFGMGFGIRDGNGIMFISHVGQVYPSGFLPLAAGNVRQRSPVEIYRNADLFISIRDIDRLKGKCGRCEFKAICGGSRARAYASTRDYLESDPLCPYQPRAS
ncbi:MAG: TIGR04053 family radical SAM/SPASM domain-containing protein [Candidatus Bipolaricaulia bacterium]